jgi:hypothetical protein
MDHLAISDLPTCNETMTFAAPVAPVGLRRAQSYFLCQRCGRVETASRTARPDLTQRSPYSAAIATRPVGPREVEEQPAGHQGGRAAAVAPPPASSSSPEQELRVLFPNSSAASG